MHVFSRAHAIVEAAPAAIGAAYASLLASLPSYILAIHITSTLDGDAYLSFDSGVTDHVWVPAAPETYSGGPLIPQHIDIPLPGNNPTALEGKSLQIKDGASAANNGKISITIFYGT